MLKVNTVIEGDCLEVMKQLPDNCIDTILTDPPYSLNFMNKKWDNEIAFNPEVWRECLRVAKPGATLMAFGGTRTHHRLASSIEDAGWEIRDCISYFSDGTQQEQAFMASLNDEQLAAYMELHYPGYQMAWVYGQGIGLGHNVSKGIDKREGNVRDVIGERYTRDLSRKNGKHKGDMLVNYYDGCANIPITAPASPLATKFDGWNSRLKPAYEPIVLAMAPMGQSYAVNAEKWGVAGLWIDGGRVPTNWESDPTRRGWQGGGTKFRYDQSHRKVIGEKTPPSSLGRYPSNVVISGEPSVLAEFDKAGVRPTSGRLGQSGNGQKTGLFNMGSIRQETYFDSGSVARFFAHCPPDTSPARFIYQAKASGKERGAANNHPTVKPLSLLKYLARLSKTPDGGIVLDPFAGSGTTALACLSEGRDYILIEKESAYVDICKRRIAEYTGQEIETKEIELSETEMVKQLSLW